jgi:hypothetical protein
MKSAVSMDVITRLRMWSSFAVGPGTSRARLATARSRSERVTIPTSLSPCTTGKRFDIATFHHPHELIKRHAFSCGAQIVLRHDLADIATVRMHEIRSHFTGQ